MAEPNVVVNCPHCGFPYPMTTMQREVYRGRNMGCMNCGRPFAVDRARSSVTQPKDAPIDTAGADQSTPTAERQEPAEDRPAALGAPRHPGAPTRLISHSTPRSNVPASVSAVSGIILFVLLAITGVTAFITNGALGGEGIDTAGKVTLIILLSLVLLLALLTIASGTRGVLLTRRPIDSGDNPSPPPPVVGGRLLATACIAIGLAGFLVGLMLLIAVLPVLRASRGP